jgi:hypothetical protein
MYLPNELILLIFNYCHSLDPILFVSKKLKDKILQPYFLIPYITNNHHHLVEMYPIFAGENRSLNFKRIREVSLISIPLRLDYPIFIREKGVNFLLKPKLNDFAARLMAIDLNKQFITNGHIEFCTLKNSYICDVVVMTPNMKYIAAGFNRDGVGLNLISFDHWRHLVIHMLNQRKTPYDFNLIKGSKCTQVNFRVFPAIDSTPGLTIQL